MNEKTNKVSHWELFGDYIKAKNRSAIEIEQNPVELVIIRKEFADIGVVFSKKDAQDCAIYWAAQERLERDRKLVDTVKSWLDAMPKHQTEQYSLYPLHAEYQQWCAENGISHIMLPTRKFAESLKSKGWRKKSNGKVRYWITPVLCTCAKHNRKTGDK
jgi:hypothetical protein